jgi:hypothetical protein
VAAAWVWCTKPKTSSCSAMMMKRMPESTLDREYWVPTIRAAIELHRNNPAKALELLQVTSPYEFSDSCSLYAVYLRGQARLLLSEGKDAAADFQEVLDHKGLVANGDQGARWRTWASRGRTQWRKTPSRPAPHIKTSSRCGKMPTPTFRFSKKLRRSTPSCSNAALEIYMLIGMDLSALGPALRRPAAPHESANRSLGSLLISGDDSDGLNRGGRNNLVTQQNRLFPRCWVMLHPAYKFYRVGDDLHPEAHIDATPLENGAAARAALQSDRSPHGEKLAAPDQHLTGVAVENRDLIQTVTCLDGQRG